MTLARLAAMATLALAVCTAPLATAAQRLGECSGGE